MDLIWFLVKNFPSGVLFSRAKHSIFKSAGDRSKHLVEDPLGCLCYNLFTIKSNFSILRSSGERGKHLVEAKSKLFSSNINFRFG